MPENNVNIGDFIVRGNDICVNCPFIDLEYRYDDQVIAMCKNKDICSWIYAKLKRRGY